MFVESYSEDFNFVFSYGVMKKNVLDTGNNTYTKDLVIDGVRTTELKLTEQEKKDIFSHMSEIGLFQYPEEVEGVYVEPEHGYEFTITINGKVMNINWIGIFNESQQSLEFKSLVDKIINMIQSKDEYKLLPAANGYYE